MVRRIAVAALSTTLLIIIFSTIALASNAAEPSQVPWWKATTGVLAIPAALIGLIYSYLLAQKTRLESQKIALEIAEKKQEVEKIAGSAGRSVAEMVKPLMGERFIQYALLRFIILYLVLQIWGLVEEGYELVFTGVSVGLTSAHHLNLSSPWVVAPFLVIQKLPRIGYWLLFFSMGWPLFKDVNTIVGLDVKDFFRVRGRRTREAD